MAHVSIETRQKRRFSVEICQQLEVAPDPPVGIGRVIYISIQNSEPDTLTKFEEKLLTQFSTSCRGSRSLRQISQIGSSITSQIPSHSDEFEMNSRGPAPDSTAPPPRGARPRDGGVGGMDA